MDRSVKTVFKIPVYLILLVFLISTAGCGSSGNIKVMPAMKNKIDLKAKQYKVTVAETRTVDTYMDVDAVISYGQSEDLSFKIDYCHLTDVYVEEDDNVVEGQLLAEVDSSELEYRLAGRQNDLKRVQLRYNQVLNESGTENPNRNSQLESLKLDMDSITYDINNINQLISETRLIAPYSGVITAIAKEFEPGETIQAYDTIMTIAKPGTFRLDSTILNKAGTSESGILDLSGLVTGMKVTIIHGAEENRVEIPATITKIINMDPGIIYDASRILAAPPPLRLCIEPDGENTDKLFVDRSVTVRIHTGKLENVVVLPQAAIRGFGKDQIVSVVKGERLVTRRIITGYKDTNENIVVVTSGLRAGETVVLN